MKRFFSFIVLACVLSLSASAEFFRFAQLSDLHVSPTNPQPLEDLRRSISEIAANPHIAFVIASGDITEAGDRASLLQVKAELDRLPIPYYVTSGNHETTWSESGCTAFDQVFGSSRFAFAYDQCFFLGFNSGPFLKMMDGHVAPQDIEWLRHTLDSVRTATPARKIFAVTHYPLQEGDVDNWFDVTDVLRQYNVQAVLGGHYHRNLLYSADGMPDVLARSNLRGRDSVGGYTIVAVGPDSIRWQEKQIGIDPVHWLSLPLGQMAYPSPAAERPSYEVNAHYPEVHELWSRQIGVALLEAPAVGRKNLYFGDDKGCFWALDRRTARLRWNYQTASRIKCAPAVGEGRVVFGSTDGNIYCLAEKNGHLQWKVGTSAPVMGCPVITKLPNGIPVVLIGGSDHSFRCLELLTGAEVWRFTGLQGYVVARPCVYDNKVIFGAWDCHLYALNLADGTLCWSWSNGHPSDKYSPAAVWPVASHGRVFIVAPDRVFTCLDARTGQVVYRTAEHKVRESIGISADGSTIFSRCMEDSIIAMDATTSEPRTLWAVDAAYGYDHNPSMMQSAGGVIVFGTRSGLLHGVAARDMRYRGRRVAAGTVLWRHKLGNSVINTVVPVSASECFLTSTSGFVTRIQVK